MAAALTQSRPSAWIARWRPILPLFVAEFVVWLGFGAFLPILPIYLSTRGIDFATLGLIVAAWPAARLVAEPIFGWIADRTSRKPLMVAALIANAIVLPLPLFVSGAAAFVVLRAFAGLATAAYDPAARGFVVDATPADRQGEAFGLYGAAQMGGLLFGPAIGGFGASITGNESVVFWLAAVSSAAASLIVAVAVREGRRTRVRGRDPGRGPGRAVRLADGDPRRQRWSRRARPCRRPAAPGVAAQPAPGRSHRDQRRQRLRPGHV